MGGRELGVVEIKECTCSELLSFFSFHFSRHRERLSCDKGLSLETGHQEAVRTQCMWSAFIPFPSCVVLSLRCSIDCFMM